MTPGRKQSRIQRYLTILLESRGGHTVVILLFIGYCLLFSYLSIAQHESLHTHAFDLGYLDQVVWNTAHGRPFVHSFSTKPPNFLGAHFSPILALLAPLYWIWPDVRALLIVQTLGIAFGGLVLYWLLAQEHRSLALIVLLGYYMNPALHAINLTEFHILTLVIPFLSMSLYFLARRRYRPLFFSLVLALLCREDIFIPVVAIGIYLLFLPGSRKWGLLILSVGLFWIGLVVKFQEILWGASLVRFAQRYPHLGSNPSEALRKVLGDPGLLFRELLYIEKAKATLRILFPTAFLPLLAPDIFLLATPIFLYLQLSSSPELYLLRGWYASHILPILYFAIAIGLLRLSTRWRPWAAALLLVASLSGYWALSPGPLAKQFDGTRFAITERARASQRLFRQIPPEASVSAQTSLVPHLSHREVIYLFPNPQTARAEYIILDTQGEKYPLEADEYEKSLHALLSSPRYDLVSEIQGFLLFQRSDEADIQYPLSVKFKEGIALLGFDVAVEDSEGAFSEEVLPLRPGDKGGRVRLTLWWEALAPVEEDYTVFTHLLNGQGRLIGGHDSMPANGSRPTSGWKTGRVVRDIHYIAFEAGEDLGEIIIEVGLYDLETGRRLELEDGQDKVILGWLPE